MKAMLEAAAAAILAFGLLAQPTAPADAATATRKDPRYDALGIVDIASVTVKNKAKELVIEVKAPGFDPTAEPMRPLDQTLALLAIDAGESELPIRPGAHANARWWLIELNEADESGPRRLQLLQYGEDDWLYQRCPAATSRVEPGLLKLVVPQSCFGRYAGGTLKADVELRGMADLVGSELRLSVPAVGDRLRQPYRLGQNGADRRLRRPDRLIAASRPDRHADPSRLQP